MRELKKCPCCGSNDISICDEWYDGECDCIAVICNNCGIMTRPNPRPTNCDGDSYSEGDEEYDAAVDDAVDSWNCRMSSESGISETVLGIADRIISRCMSFMNLEKFKPESSDFVELNLLTEKVRLLRKRISEGEFGNSHKDHDCSSIERDIRSEQNDRIDSAEQQTTIERRISDMINRATDELSSDRHQQDTSINTQTVCTSTREPAYFYTNRVASPSIHIPTEITEHSTVAQVILPEEESNLYREASNRAIPSVEASNRAMPPDDFPF